MITSKLTKKARTTVPLVVRAAPHLGEGDEIAYSIHDDAAVIRKAVTSGAPEEPFATFAEWDSEVDRRAYADL